MIRYTSESPRTFPKPLLKRRYFWNKILITFFLVFICAYVFFIQKYIITEIDERDEIQLQAGGNYDKSSFRHKLSNNNNEVEPKRSLTFQTGESFIQHRMGIINAVIFSIIQQRTIIISQNAFCLGGGDCDSNNLFYDWERFLQVLYENNVAFRYSESDDLQLESKFVCGKAFKQSCYQDLQQQNSQSKLHLMFPEIIPIPFKVAKDKKLLIKQLLEGLQLSEYYNKVKEKSVSRIQFICGSHNYSTIYMNKSASEKNALEYLNGNQLFYSTYGKHIGAQIQLKEFEEDVPLFIWSSNINIWSSEPVIQLFQNLEKQEREYVLENPIYSDVELEQQYLTAINYYISLDAHRTLGDGSSVITQMLVLERQLHGKWASYFNQEMLQMFNMYPIFDVPWIFTHNAWSSRVDYLVKVAVRSAIEIGGVNPFCLFSGDRNSDIGKWLEKMGVKLISHEPKWMSHLVMKNSRGKEYRDIHSHLYGSPEGIIGTFLRIDIPILSELSQYPYVLFTDSDIYFRKRFSFADLPQPLPQSIGMGYEVFPAFPYNAGISVMNMFNLRLNYDNFVKFILSNEYALFFPGYGPGDQGALNQFYEVTVKNWFLPEIFNAKPYKQFDNDSVIVHFHGPKPYDYYDYGTVGSCRPILEKLCAMAVQKGMCEYIKEWAQFSQEDDIGQKLVGVCQSNLQFMQQNYNTIVSLGK
eukprot:TRINITY_DN10082_c0_g2_i2.p1 TRINITY_DN10082_c0_g2~~TRINITY_DN10082_c0_g2_i2.p1  ORF type:complete len:696 (+),score=69.78 TRINITY_DN10082_c0_g2_i2:87-2174(+)